MGRRPELKSDEFFVFTPIVIEILSCEHFFTAEKVLPFIGASVHELYFCTGDASTGARYDSTVAM